MRFLPIGDFSRGSDCFVLYYFHQETCNNGRRPVDPNPNYALYYLCFCFAFRKLPLCQYFEVMCRCNAVSIALVVAGCVIVSEIVIVVLVLLYACLVLVYKC